MDEDHICTCPPQSPFRWREHTHPTIFARDNTFSPKGDTGLSASQVASQGVQTQRDAGKVPGYLPGVSRDAAAEKERLVNFQVAEQRRKRA